MSPFAFFWLIVLITAVTALSWRLGRVFYRRRLERAARGWGLRYCAEDQFRLIQKLGNRFPIVGASDLRVRDLMYGASETSHQYIFTVEYTIGLMGEKTRRPCVVSLVEPRLPGTREIVVAVAPEGRRMEQYGYFVQMTAPAGEVGA